jgi:hypothetical protein
MIGVFDAMHRADEEERRGEERKGKRQGKGMRGMILGSIVVFEIISSIRNIPHKHSDQHRLLEV